MIGSKFLLVLVLVSFSCLVVGQEDGDLKAVIVLYRHGDRSPISSWPNDIYIGNTTLWPDGYGQLNNLGKERQYRLGQWLRNRYDGFLPARYNLNDIYVRSTDVDRTLMSAASNLAGLYPPSGDQVWNDGLSWQPIPIHTINEDEDPILAAPTCPKHNILQEELLNSTEVQRFYQEHAELFKNLSDFTGYPVEEMGFKSISTLFSVITIYREFNLSLPQWTEDYWPEIKSIAAIQFQIATFTPDLARLRAGPFVNFLINYLNSINSTLIANERGENTFSSEEEDNTLSSVDGIDVRKFLMLSAHDTTIGDRTNAMGVFPGAVPQFASTVIWEIKSKNGSNGDLYLNMYFKNSTDFNPLTLPGCDFDCSINDFATILEPLNASVDQWLQECNEN